MVQFLGPERGLTPDRFVLIQYQDQFAILAGIQGGYLDGDSWRRSTAIHSVEKDGDLYFVKTQSGSEYALDMVRVGFTNLTSAIWAQIEGFDHDNKVKLIHEQSDIASILDSFLEK